MDNANLINHRQDDYLPCNAYNGNTVSEKGIYKFTEEGKYYFSFMENGKVILRSEGYLNEAGRDNGIASVLNNLEQESQYKVINLENVGWVVALFAVNYQEIARSCPFATEDEVRLLLPGARAKAKAELLLNSSSSAAAAVRLEAEDNYLVCHEYEERIHERSANHANFIQFKHPSNDQYYFAWVAKDNHIILRSEGYVSEAARENGIISVTKNKDLKERFRVEEKRGLYWLVLTAGNQLEIGRSCPKKSEAECWALINPSVAEPVMAAAAPIPLPQAVGSGFRWWWLLGLLALLGLFLIWKSCNKTASVDPSPSVETAVPAVPVAKDTDGDGINDDVDKCPNTAGIADNMGCPEMIFYYKRDDADLSVEEKADLDKLVVWMGKHPELSISIEGHTSTLGESDYNQKLSERRTQNSVNYLVSKGIDAGRLKAVGYGEQFPIGDNSTEEGRAASRRVVIKIAK